MIQAIRSSALTPGQLPGRVTLLYGLPIMSYTYSMNRKYTAIIKEDAGWWIGWVEEVPGVNCQEASREALIESLQLTLREAIEENRSDAINAAGEDFEELEIAV